MTSLLVTKTLFANKINTIAVFAVLEATIILQKYCSTIQRAKYGTLGRFGLTSYHMYSPVRTLKKIWIKGYGKSDMRLCVLCCQCNTNILNGIHKNL